MTQHTQHTPGPWGIRPNTQADYEVWSEATHDLICLPTGGAYKTADEKRANARLIASAPELLASAYLALDTLDAISREGVDMRTFNDGGIGFDAIASLKAIIRKAEGGE